MLRIRSRSVALLGALVILPVASACGSSGGGDSTTSADPADARGAAKTLYFSAVRDETPGACKSHGANVFEDKEANTCLQLGKPEVTVTSVHSATVVSEPQLGVTIELQPKDAGRLKSLTTRLSRQTSPQNKLAVTVGSSTHQRLLSAPAVQEPITGPSMQISGGFTKKSAEQLVHDLGH